MASMVCWAPEEPNCLSLSRALRRLLGGSIVVNGTQAHISTVSDAVKHGIVLVPEDRQRDGLIPDLSIRENIAIGAMQGIWLSRGTATRSRAESS